MTTASPAFAPIDRWDGTATSRAGWGGGLRLTIVGAAHVALLLGLAELAAQPEVRTLAKEVMARFVEEAPPVAQAPRPAAPPRRPPPAPVPIMTAAAESAPSTSFAVAPQPPALPDPPFPAVPATAIPVTAASFAADYLHNPKPAYPPASRRFSEEGRVLLRVQVSAQGAATAVDVKQSSGYARLDDAAREAVRRWRFVPARRGDEAIDSWVSVPIVFSLQAS